MTQADRIGNQLNFFAGRVIGKMQLRIYQVLASSTPVDTGFARGSLTPSVGAAPTSVAVAPGNKAEAAREGSLMRSSNRARALFIASSYSIKQGPAFLTYRASYVGELDKGSSSQAAAGFIGRGIIKGIRTLGRVR